MTTPAWTLQFYDGTTTVAFTTSPYSVRGWSVSGPAGNDLTTEAIDVRRLGISGQTIYDHLDQIATLERMFAQARWRWAGGQPKSYIPAVYVRWQRSGAYDQYRGEVTDGQVEYDRYTLAYGWRTDALLATITYTRLNFWEDGTEQEVAKVNGNESSPGTPEAAALNIFNNNDATGTTPNKRVNYAHIAAAAIAGDLPAPCRIELTNTVAGTPRSRRHYVGLAIRPDPANLDYWFEAEDATGASPTVEAASSGGNYVRYALTGSEATAFTWALSTAQLNAFGGNWYAVLMRTRAVVPASTKLRFKFQYQSTTIWQMDAQVTATTTGPFNTSDFLQQIATLQMPPLQITGNYGDLDLVMTATGSGNLDLDYICFMPLDGYARIQNKIAYGLEQNAVLVLDGISRPAQVYASHSSEGVPDFNAYSQGAPPIYLRPGVAQRLVFLWDAADSTALPARTATVRVYYRPRRKSL